MCTTGVVRLADGSYALFKNKDFGRAHLDDLLWIDGDRFGVMGMTTWAGDDPSLDEYSGFSIGANRHGLLCCDSNVVTLDGHQNYDVMTEVALRHGTDVPTAVAAIRSACAAEATSWGNLIMIDRQGAAVVEVRGHDVAVTLVDGPTARSNHHLALGHHELQEDHHTTELRLASAQRNLDRAAVLDDVFALQAAHDDGATGVCNHSDLTTVYSYVLQMTSDGLRLHVVQGRPCSGSPRVTLPVPLGSAYSVSAAARFLADYPTANKRNAAA